MLADWRRTDAETRGCVTCLAVLLAAFAALVDLLPVQALVRTFWSAGHAWWSSVVASAVVLVSAPLVAAVAIAALLRLRDAVTREMGDAARVDSGAALSIDELLALAAVGLGLCAGVLVGLGLVSVLGAVLP